MVDESVTKNEDWLFGWWRTHKDEYPWMAAAARDYLAIPAAEVSVERLLSCGRDLLGLHQHSLKGEMMRKMMLLRDVSRSMDASELHSMFDYFDLFGVEHTLDIA